MGRRVTVSPDHAVHSCGRTCWSFGTAAASRGHAGGHGADVLCSVGSFLPPEPRLKRASPWRWPWLASATPHRFLRRSQDPGESVRALPLQTSSPLLDPVFLIQASTDARLGFQILSLVENAAENTGTNLSLRPCFRFCLMCTQSGTTGSYGDAVFRFWGASIPFPWWRPHRTPRPLHVASACPHRPVLVSDFR